MTAITQTFDNARRTAIAFLAGPLFVGLELAIVEPATREFDAGWVFFYQNARYIETHQIEDALVGNAPIFVPRDGMAACTVSYHRPLEISMAAYLSCGDPNAAALAQVVLKGWKPGAMKVAANKAIRQYSSLGLTSAKQVVDECLDGIEPRVDTANVNAAIALAEALVKIGFFAEIAYGTHVRHA